jgi:hypothetical protein
MSLEQPDGTFAWEKLDKVLAHMWRHPLTRANGIVVLNNAYFGRGTEVDWAMSLIQQAMANNNVAMLDVKAIRYAADQGDKVKQGHLAVLKAVRLAKDTAYQMDLNDLALQANEQIEQSGMGPYAMLR